MRTFTNNNRGEAKLGATRIDVCTYLLITSFSVFFFSFSLTKRIAQLRFVIRLKELIYVRILDYIGYLYVTIHIC